MDKEVENLLQRPAFRVMGPLRNSLAVTTCLGVGVHGVGFDILGPDPRGIDLLFVEEQDFVALFLAVKPLDHPWPPGVPGQQSVNEPSREQDSVNV